MTVLPALASAWLLGLSLGLTACTATCLPFMGTWVLARGSAAVWPDTLSFLAGRISAYAMLGFAAGMAGAWLAAAIKGGVGNVAIGLASIAAGMWLIAGRGRHGCGAGRRAGWASPFALGFSLSLVPCAPLASLLAFAAQAGSAVAGATQGLAFGLGAAVTPLLVALPLLGRFGESLRQQRAWLGNGLRRGGGLVLVILGLYRIPMGA